MTAAAITTVPSVGRVHGASRVATSAEMAATTSRLSTSRRPDRQDPLRALFALVAAGVMVATGSAPAGAQANPSRASALVASPAAEELSRVRQQAEEARTQLEHFLNSLVGRPATIALLDSLGSMQKSTAVLERRLALLQDRVNFQMVEERLERDSSAPQGWFGVDVQTVGTSTEQGDGRILVSTEYPRVVSVEPGSPAARAGLIAGDRLISIRGIDLRGQALDLRSVLKPGTRVPVRVDRDGMRRDFTVAVTVRPTSYAPGTRVRLYALSPNAPTVANARAASAASAAAVADLAATLRTSRVDVVPSQSVVHSWRNEAVAPSPLTYLFRSSPSILVVAGAELMHMTKALRESLGVSGGVYVISVVPWTPAELAGLRAGDVVQRADGIELDAPLDFYRVLQAQADGLLKLDVVRSGRPLSTAIRW